MRFLFLLIASFFVVSGSSLVLNKAQLFPRPSVQGYSIVDSRAASDITHMVTPVLKEGVVFPTLSAQAVLAVDLDSDRPLYEKNPFGQLLPASTTKIITALVAMDKYPQDAVFTVEDIVVEGQKMRLVKGERITVENLLQGLLIFSANDAAEVLAGNYPGGRDKFIEAMNLKAKELGLNDTFFDNPTGLDGEGHVTTARDLVRASEVAMGRPLFREIVGTKEIVVTSEDGQFSHRLVNINELVGKVEGVLGVKTGWTQNARENLVAYIERGDKKIMIAILGSQDRFGETEKLIDWIFNSYEWREVAVQR